MNRIKLVVDSSIVIKWFVSESYSNEARRILDGYQTEEYTLLAPDLLYAEIGNIVWKKCRLQGLAAEDARRIIVAFCLLDIHCTPGAILLNDAYALAFTYHCTVYDAMYVALSQREDSLLVSADEKLITLFKELPFAPVWVAEWDNR